ncbi:hypothetical protein PoB_006679800 [Plakobranchus ocellatus]|uniref:Uncharacterized protein n=1 Tax=Plakobranchus ocellatus TaxID=259542 RepID=A0AAV4D808_9GAST|nr:hypothetical protein PoB_006679800 [Plakobranchus ocellatus]
MYNCIWKREVWFLCIASPQQGNLRLSGPPSGQGASGGARTRDRGSLQISGRTPTAPPMPGRERRAVVKGSVVRLSIYNQVFYSKYNLGFFKRSKGKCDFCTELGNRQDKEYA